MNKTTMKNLLNLDMGKDACKLYLFYFKDEKWRIYNSPPYLDLKKLGDREIAIENVCQKKKVKPKNVILGYKVAYIDATPHMHLRGDVVLEAI